MFVLNGISNDIRKKAKEAVDFIVGYGEGTHGISMGAFQTTPSYSCRKEMKDVFITSLIKARFIAYQGAGNGNYSSRHRNHLNQLFRRWYINYNVHSMQVNIVDELREDKDMAMLTGIELASAMFDVIDYNESETISLVPDSI